MPRAAVAVAGSNAEQLSSLGEQLGYGRRLRPGRAQVGLILLAVLGIWVVFVFASVLGQLNEAATREQAISAETTTLQRRLDAGQRELVLVQTDAFQRIQARAYGLGAPGEVVFSLDAGAPSPPPITPLGAAPAAAKAQTPLDAWLRVLFGN
jgi:hypothetical protein